MRQLLQDSLELKFELSESAEGRLVLRGKFAQADKPTANGRIYPRALWEREFSRLEKKIEERKIYGELDHPADGKTKLQRAAVIITSLGLNSDGDVIGEMEVMDTSMGKELKAIHAAGGAIGVSSRGWGSVKTNESGYAVVQEDFKLLTFDPVADPAEEGAYPTEVRRNEEVEPEAQASDTEVKDDDGSEEEASTDKPVTEDVAVDEAPKDEQPSDDEEEVKEQGTEDEAKAPEELGEPEVQAECGCDDMKATEEEGGDQEVVADSEDAEKVEESVEAEASKADVQAVLVSVLSEEFKQFAASSEARIQDLSESKVRLESELSVMTKAVKALGFELYIERNLAQHPRCAAIRESFGDFSGVRDLEDLKSKTRVFVEEVKALVSKQSKRVETLENSLADAMDAKRLAESKCEAAIRERDEALKAGLTAVARSYLDRRLVGNANAAIVRERFEALENKSKENIDRLLSEDLQCRVNAGSDFSAIRSRLSARARMEASTLQEGKTLTENKEDGRMVEESLKDTLVKDAKSKTENTSFEVIQGTRYSIEEMSRLAGTLLG